MSELRKEAQCPFCMSTEHYKYDPIGYVSSPEHAWRADKGPGITIALKHEPTCPRYMKCMSCGGDAITGIFGQCWTCCEKDEEQHNDETVDLTPIVTRVRIIPRDGGEPVEASGAMAVSVVAGPKCRLVDLLGQGVVHLDGFSFARVENHVSDGFYTVEAVSVDDFVPDFFRCNACGNIDGDAFGYDANPKGLPPTEAPMLAVVLPSGNYTGEEQRIMEAVQKHELRQAGKTADFTEGAEQRARWAGTGPRRGAGAEPSPQADSTNAAFQSKVASAAAEVLGKAGGLYANAVATGHLPARAVPIAEIFGCARTGEEGAVYCQKCKSYDVHGVSGEERNRLMLERCERDLSREDVDPGGQAVLNNEREFITQMHIKVINGGLGSLTDAEVLRLYKNYRKLES